MRDTAKTAKEFEKALFKLLESKNYHDITVNEICTLSNKTKMTFYHYHKDKDALLAVASINLINAEYDKEYYKILRKTSFMSLLVMRMIIYLVIDAQWNY